MPENESTRVSRLLDRMYNNPVLSIIIIAGMIVLSVSTITGAVHSLVKDVTQFFGSDPKNDILDSPKPVLSTTTPTTYNYIYSRVRNSSEDVVDFEVLENGDWVPYQLEPSRSQEFNVKSETDEAVKVRYVTKIGQTGETKIATLQSVFRHGRSPTSREMDSVGNDFHNDMGAGNLHLSEDPEPVDGAATVNPRVAKVGEIVTFAATFSKGNDYYSFSWTGTDDLHSLYPRISKRYTTPGIKTATVEITSHYRTIKRKCAVTITE